MTDSPASTRHVFMVRVWEEASADQPTQWRGSVEHVRSGRTVYFIDFHDVQAFILGVLRGTDPNPPPGGTS